MSILTVDSTPILGSMVDYQRPVPAAILPYRPQPLSKDSHSPNPSYQNISPQTQSLHRHSRSTSSSGLAYPSAGSSPSPARYQNTFQAHSRSLSANAYPPMANMNFAMHREPTTISTNTAATSHSSLPRRSTSSRSAGSTQPSSYVALMRKQKATVWCDRAQSIDPRLAAQQRAAKQRAVLEVHGQGTQYASSGGRTSTLSSSGVVGKIRHGGVPRAPGYVGTGNLSGAGLPMRLSANEMLGDEEEERGSLDHTHQHQRTGSGRSSANSAQFRSGYPRPEAGRNTPPESVSPPAPPSIPEAAPAAESVDEDSFGAAMDMTAPNAGKLAVDQAKRAEDLRRRGSVDERAMSMGTGVRLFVANPDVQED